jgi:hypothetical protein
MADTCTIMTIIIIIIIITSTQPSHPHNDNGSIAEATPMESPVIIAPVMPEKASGGGRGGGGCSDENKLGGGGKGEHWALWSAGGIVWINTNF